MQQNTWTLWALFALSAVISRLQTGAFRFLHVYAVFLVLFFIMEFLYFGVGIPVWDQTEITINAYSWYSHFLASHYGGKGEKTYADFSEGLFFDDYTLSPGEAMVNKYEHIFKELKLAPGMTLLDCGCGNGQWLDFCKKKGVNAVGLTFSQEQVDEIKSKGLVAHNKDFRNFYEEFVGKMDAVTFLGPTEHTTEGHGIDAETRAFQTYTGFLRNARMYLKPNGRIMMTTLVLNNFTRTPEQMWRSYLLHRHFGGYYAQRETLDSAIKYAGLSQLSVTDFTRDYHWIGQIEPRHPGGKHKIDMGENSMDKIMYTAWGALCDPFLLHRWVYWYTDTWAWHVGALAQTKPISDEQIKKSLSNLNYYLLEAKTKEDTIEVEVDDASS